MAMQNEANISLSKLHDHYRTDRWGPADCQVFGEFFCRPRAQRVTGWCHAGRD
jgi:hypothetical protein